MYFEFEQNRRVYVVYVVHGHLFFVRSTRDFFFFFVDTRAHVHERLLLPRCSKILVGAERV